MVIEDVINFDDLLTYEAYEADEDLLIEAILV